MVYDVFVNISEHAVRFCNLDQIFMCAGVWGGVVVNALRY